MNNYQPKPNHLKRKIVKFLGRVLVRLLTRFELSGVDNLPTAGAYIMAGNHVAAMESILMVCFAPKMIEILGSGDIPLDPKLARFANLYGFIPINRGEIDQKGLNAALTVLRDGGVLGVFPEGGIWENTLKKPKPGICWLSLKSSAPIIPIGFIGMRSALGNALKFKFPTIKMVIGKPVSTNDFYTEALPMKDSLLRGAKFVMDRIADLLPEDEKSGNTSMDASGNKLIFEELHIDSGYVKALEFCNMESFTKIIEHPVIMDVFLRNLRLPVKPLMVREQFINAEQVLKACLAIKEVLSEKPGFLTYRFGIDEGLRMNNSVTILCDHLEKSKSDNIQIKIHRE